MVEELRRRGFWCVEKSHRGLITGEFRKPVQPLAECETYQEVSMPRTVKSRRCGHRIAGSSHGGCRVRKSRGGIERENDEHVRLISGDSSWPTLACANHWDRSPVPDSPIAAHLRTHRIFRHERHGTIASTCSRISVLHTLVDRKNVTVLHT